MEEASLRRGHGEKSWNSNRGASGSDLEATETHLGRVWEEILEVSAVGFPLSPSKHKLEINRGIL